MHGGESAGVGKRYGRGFQERKKGTNHTKRWEDRRKGVNMRMMCTVGKGRFEICI